MNCASFYRFSRLCLDHFRKNFVSARFRVLVARESSNALVKNANKIVDLWCHLVALGHFRESLSDSAGVIKLEALGVAL